MTVLEQCPSNFIHITVSRRYAQIQTNRWRPEAPIDLITLHSVGTWLLTVTLRFGAPAASCTYWRACANNSHTFGKGYHIHGVLAAHRCKLTDRRGGWTADAGPVELECQRFKFNQSSPLASIDGRSGSKGVSGGRFGLYQAGPIVWIFDHFRWRFELAWTYSKTD